MARRAHPPPDLAPARRAWIHAASVGEVLAAAPVAAVLRKLRPGIEVALSTNTSTGLEAARRILPDVPAFAMPLDFSGRVEDAFQRVKPSVLILIEGELWPQLLAGAERRRIGVLCVNARLTEKGCASYRRLGALFKPTLMRVNAYLAQGEDPAERLRSLGVPPERIRVIPNVKGAAPPPASPEWLRPPGGPLFVAGSTHPGEEEAVLDAWMAMGGSWRLLVAPRHPQRFEAVEALLRKAPGAAFWRRSSPPHPGWRICLLDTVGELAQAYAAADLAFVGGTLAEVGGHNLLEPAAAGVPVLCGPHTAHVAGDRARLEAAGALRVVGSAADLASAARALAEDPGLRRRMGEAGPGTLRDGALEALERALDPLLPPA